MNEYIYISSDLFVVFPLPLSVVLRRLQEFIPWVIS